MKTILSESGILYLCIVSTELDSQNAVGPAQDIWGQCVLEGVISYLLWDDWDNTRPLSLVSINILPSH